MLSANSNLYSHKSSGVDERKLTEVFETCDEDKKGYLSREDLKVAVVMLFGYKPSKTSDWKINLTSVWQSFCKKPIASWSLIFNPANETEVNSMILMARKDSSGVYLDQFIKLMRAKFSAQHTDDEMRQIFMAFDIQCRGFLILDDFRRAFKHVVPQFSERTILEAFRVQKKNHNVASEAIGCTTNFSSANEESLALRSNIAHCL